MICSFGGARIPGCFFATWRCQQRRRYLGLIHLCVELHCSALGRLSCDACVQHTIWIRHKSTIDIYDPPAVSPHFYDVSFYFSHLSFFWSNIFCRYK